MEILSWAAFGLVLAGAALAVFLSVRYAHLTRAAEDKTS